MPLYTIAMFRSKDSKAKHAPLQDSFSAKPRIQLYVVGGSCAGWGWTQTQLLLVPLLLHQHVLSGFTKTFNDPSNNVFTFDQIHLPQLLIGQMAVVAVLTHWQKHCRST